MATKPIVAGVLLACLMGAGALAGRAYAHWHKRPAPQHSPPVPSAAASASRLQRLEVPWVAPGSVKIDGEMTDMGWLPSPHTGWWPSTKTGKMAVPASEARLVWTDGQLLMELYASDQDIQANPHPTDAPQGNDDAFHVTLTRADGMAFHLDINAVGAIADSQQAPGQPPDASWSSQVNLKADVDDDESVNNSSDDDEEWLVEMAIPFASLGMQGTPGEKLKLDLNRCDTSKKGVLDCGATTLEIELGPRTH